MIFNDHSRVWLYACKKRKYYIHIFSGFIKISNGGAYEHVGDLESFYTRATFRGITKEARFLRNEEELMKVH